MTRPSLIGADWGTTNFRMFLYDMHGKVMARHTANIGLKNLGVLSFEQALISVLKDDFEGLDHLPFILSGMVGSRQGWIEAPYAPCPSSVGDIAARLVRAPHPRLDVAIVPGLFAKSADTGLLNVMRGEETQIFGLLSAPDQANTHKNGVFILPGTHSKWARVRDGVIETFSTHMTGEMFHVLKSHSILGLLMQGNEDSESAFLLGVERGMKDKAFLSLIFSVRTEALFHNINPEDLSSYLSGLLIGSEIAAETKANGIVPIGLIGDGALVELYRRALTFAGFTTIHHYDGDAASSCGLWAINALR